MSAVEAGEEVVVALVASPEDGHGWDYLVRRRNRSTASATDATMMATLQTTAFQALGPTAVPLRRPRTVSMTWVSGWT